MFKSAVACLLLCSQFVSANEFSIVASDWWKQGVANDVVQQDDPLSFQLAPHWRLGLTSTPFNQPALAIDFTPFSRLRSAENYGIGREEPLTFRVTLKGWELLETDTESGRSQFMSLDRYREGDTRKQYIALSISKKF